MVLEDVDLGSTSCCFVLGGASAGRGLQGRVFVVSPRYGEVPRASNARQRRRECVRERRLKLAEPFLDQLLFFELGPSGHVWRYFWICIVVLLQS